MAGEGVAEGKGGGGAARRGPAGGSSTPRAAEGAQSRCRVPSEGGGRPAVSGVGAGGLCSPRAGGDRPSPPPPFPRPGTGGPARTEPSSGRGVVLPARCVRFPAQCGGEPRPAPRAARTVGTAEMRLVAPGSIAEPRAVLRWCRPYVSGVASAPRRWALPWGGCVPPSPLSGEPALPSTRGKCSPVFWRLQGAQVTGTEGGCEC